jgi:hypothetical protein
MTEATKTLSHRQTEALDRAISSASFTNYPAIYQGFLAKGIREDEIKPRENVFTFNAWKAKGRSVRKGEHGIKVVTFIECSGVEIRLVAKRRRLAIVAHTPQRSFTSLRLSQQAKRDRRRDRAYARDYVRDPGEDAEDRWNELHGDQQ